MSKIKLGEKLNEIADKLGYKNPLAAPRLEKIVVNMGFGSLKDDKKFLESAKKDIAVITGQMPNVRAAKKSIAGFKLRQGDIIGIAVTLRGKRMWDFFDKLISVVFPRLREFRGLSRKSFDKRGNYTFGISDHTVFPEIDANKVDRIKSLQVTLSTTALDDDSAYELLKVLGFPFRD